MGRMRSKVNWWWTSPPSSGNRITLNPVCNALSVPVVCAHPDRLRADGYRYRSQRLTGVTLCQDIGCAKPAHNPLDRQLFRTRH